MSKESASLIVFSDGGSRGNPGPAGIGFVIFLNDLQEEPIYSEGRAIGVATNNTAEYEAVLAALNWAQAHLTESKIDVSRVVVHLDSELVVRQILGVYKAKQPSTQRYLQLVKEVITKIGLPVEVKHVPREQNKIADMLVNQALDAAQ